MASSQSFVNKRIFSSLKGKNKNVEIGEALLQLLSPEAGKKTEGE